MELATASLTAAVIGSADIAVNSFHHQGVDRLGRGLLAVGWSPDGVVEAIEAPGRDFALGVQWHAECLTGAARAGDGSSRASWRPHRRYASLPTAMAA